MRITIVVLMLVAIIALVGSAIAVPPGKTVEYEGSTLGKVVFDGKIHMDKGLKCNDCHTKIFQMKKGQIEIKMAEMNKGQNCGTCHNGEKSFKSSDPANCKRCHKK